MHDIVRVRISSGSHGVMVWKIWIMIRWWIGHSLIRIEGMGVRTHAVHIVHVIKIIHHIVHVAHCVHGWVGRYVCLRVLVGLLLLLLLMCICYIWI